MKYLGRREADVAKALSMPVESLEVNQSLLADWQPVMITVRGEITPGVVSQLSTLLERQRRRRRQLDRRPHR